MKRILVGFGILALGFVCTIPFAGCKKSTSAQWPDKPGPKVAVSFAPLYCFTVNVTGEHGTVKSVLSAQGPHHADSSVQERVLLEDADLFIHNGLGLDDSFVQKLKTGTSNRSLKVVNLGEQLEKDPKVHSQLLGPNGMSCCKPGEEGHAHDHDAHLWLSPVLAGEMIEEIRLAMSGFEPDRQAEYKRNAEAYRLKLKAIHDDGQKLLKDKTERAFVTTHGALQYFARDFGLTIAGHLQAVPGEEPSPAELKKLIETCVKERIRIIAVEPQYASHHSPVQLKKELEAAGIRDVAIVELDSLETATAAELTPDWYERKMRANLDVLSKVLR